MNPTPNAWPSPPTWWFAAIVLVIMALALGGVWLASERDRQRAVAGQVAK